MRTATSRDLDSGITTIQLAGELTRSAVPAVRSAIGKAAGECPSAVVVDLAAVSSAEPRNVNVFATATYQAQQTWGVPVLLFAATARLRGDLAAFRTFVALYEDRWQVLTAVHAYVPRWMRAPLTPVPASPQAARSLLGRACLNWELPQKCETAQLIVSELAANAVRHARTNFDVITAYNGRYLRIAVQDGSTALPRPVELPPGGGSIVVAGSGRGLRIVQALSTHWGATRTPGGKIVWALISAAEAADRPGGDHHARRASP